MPLYNYPTIPNTATLHFRAVRRDAAAAADLQSPGTNLTIPRSSRGNGSPRAWAHKWSSAQGSVRPSTHQVILYGKPCSDWATCGMRRWQRANDATAASSQVASWLQNLDLPSLINAQSAEHSHVTEASQPLPSPQSSPAAHDLMPCVPTLAVGDVFLPIEKVMLENQVGRGGFRFGQRSTEPNLGEMQRHGAACRCMLIPTMCPYRCRRSCYYSCCCYRKQLKNKVTELRDVVA